MVRILAFSVVLLVAACAIGAPPPPGRVEDKHRDALTFAMMQLGPGVSYDEARRLSAVAWSYPQVLARGYAAELARLNAVRPPALDLKTPAVCADWADAQFRRLRQESPRTLDLHMALADPRIRTPFQHATVVVTARGAPLSSGLVLDGCRRSGNLYWLPVSQDSYKWRPQKEVLWDRTFGKKPWYARTPWEGRLVRPDPLAP
ncbi:putative lipoprotein [Citreicella sp. 357]|nr:putative lipoprotein [Citreicella sp. 357]